MAHMNPRLLNWRLAQIEERRRLRERQAAPRTWRVDELTTDAEIASRERIAALQAETELAKLQATLDAEAANVAIAAENERTIAMMKLSHQTELEAQKAAHAAAESEKDRAVALKARTVKKVNRDASGRLESISEETVQ